MCRMKTFREKCKEDSSILVNNAFEVNQTFFVLRQIMDAQNTHNEALNISPAFYHTVIRNCIQTLFVEISKMFDSRSDSLGIKSFIDRISDNIHQLDNKESIGINLFSELNGTTASVKYFNNLSEMIVWELELIKENEKIYNELKTQRDKYYAHLDRKVTNSLSKFFKKHKITYENFQQLLLLNTNLCNSFNMYFNNTTTTPWAVNYDDIKNTLYYVEKGFEITE